MVKNVTEIKSGIKGNVVIAKTEKKRCVKKIIYGIDLNVIVKMVNIYQVLLTIHLLGVIKL